MRAHVLVELQPEERRLLRSGEGEYGDGDKVYVSDNNENYSSDYSAGAEISRTTDNNPHYVH